MRRNVSMGTALSSWTSPELAGPASKGRTRDQASPGCPHQLQVVSRASPDAQSLCTWAVGWQESPVPTAVTSH